MNVTRDTPRYAPRTAGYQVAGTLIKAVVGIIGLLTVGIGAWSSVDPASFAALVQFPPHTHFLHDIGAFQVGIGVTLLLALLWEDGIAVAFGGFLTGNTLHVISHIMDNHLGGRPTDWLLLSIVSLVTTAALAVRLRQLRRIPDAGSTPASG